MPWAVTLIVKDCGSMAPLSGAYVGDGISGGYTDSYGQFIAVIDDAYTGYVVEVRKTSYNTRYFTFARSQVGTPQNTCLQPYVPPETGPTGDPDCFIVTAATGSAASEEVVGLRALRDEVAARAPLAARLIDAIYDEYWRFSPAVADEIRDSDSARMAVMALVVRPLFAWYQFAGRLALAPHDEAARVAAERELQAACPRWMQPAKISGYLQRFADEAAAPDGMPTLLAQLAPRLRAALALPLVRWAIFEPLQRTWAAAAERRELRAEVADWLAAAPLERLPLPEADALEEQLATVAALLSFAPDARAAVGTRLADAWPEARAALVRAGWCGDANARA